jgi:FkbM family methyltransferase
MSATGRHTRLLKQRMALALARHHDAGAVRRLARLASSVTRAVENDSADFVHNGEARVVEVLATPAPVTVLDVGAHHGGWALEVLPRFPSAQLHCFEIEPRNREQLRATVGDDPRVVVANCGLADTTGTIDVWYDAEHPDMTSSHATENARERIACETTTGDAYLLSAGIDHVDFLKVDVEGADFAVLARFGEALAGGRIGVLQFEFTMWAAVARTWLGDFYDLLEPKGYTVGKIYPTNVEFRP